MLNDTKLRTLKPTEKLYRITDFDGLCIEVKPTGKKFWRFRFRYLDKALMMTLGEYPIVGLAEARRLRDDAKTLLHKFLNGVCRHELIGISCRQPHCFLNGVCRHEPSEELARELFLFLNGVCRHEL